MNPNVSPTVYGGCLHAVCTTRSLLRILGQQTLLRHIVVASVILERAGLFAVLTA